MNFADKLLACAQVGLALLFAIGFFAVLFFLMLYHKEMSATEITILTGLVSVLGTLLALQQNFFFARTRPAALPDPATTTTTTTTTPALAPDSGVGVIASTTITPTSTTPEKPK